jgi:CheY-like chemotaxis protein
MPKNQFSNPSLLVIEDNRICQKVYLNILEEDYSVDMVATAKEALNCVGKKNYQCIISDLGLPDMPGEELLPLIRTSQLNKNTPVIVISAHVDEVLKQRCFASDANQVFQKPIEANLLKELIAKLFK